jgi:hypothetical protein
MCNNSRINPRNRNAVAFVSGDLHEVQGTRAATLLHSGDRRKSSSRVGGKARYIMHADHDARCGCGGSGHVRPLWSSPRASVCGSLAPRAEDMRELTDGTHVARVRDTILVCHGRSRVYLSSARGNSSVVSWDPEDPEVGVDARQFRRADRKVTLSRTRYRCTTLHM